MNVILQLKIRHRIKEYKKNQADLETSFKFVLLELNKNMNNYLNRFLQHRKNF